MNVENFGKYQMLLGMYVITGHFNLHAEHNASVEQ